MTAGKVILIPTVLHEEADNTVPPYVIEQAKLCDAYFVENEKTARRYLKKYWRDMIIDNYTWRAIHKAEHDVVSEFLQLLSKKFRLFLLSNTDAIHIDHFEQREGASFYGDFYQCFEKVYFSYEMGMRKPDAEIYTTLINRHELSPKRTLFVDDKKENTDVAKALGLHVWNLQVGKEDVIELLDKKIIQK